MPAPVPPSPGDPSTPDVPVAPDRVAAPAAPRAAKPKRKAATSAVKMTAGQVVAAVRRHYGAERDGIGPEWAGLDEYSLAPGAGLRRADLFLLRCWRGRPKGHERHVIEVKVSRSDLLAELAAPGKSAAFTEVAHRFYLATPAGLIRDDDPIPDAWGIYEVTARGTVRKVRDAVRRNDPAPLGEEAVIEAFRRAARAEARIRDAEAGGDLAAQVADLTRRLASAERARHTARRAAEKHRADLAGLLGRIASAGGWLCVCGKPTTKGVGGFVRVHADGTDCDHTRYRYPEIDYGSLAVRLGLTDPDPSELRGLPTAAEVLERARLLLAENDAGQDPAVLVGRLSALLGRRTENDPDEDPDDFALAAGTEDAGSFFGPAGP